MAWLFRSPTLRRSLSAATKLPRDIDPGYKTKQESISIAGVDDLLIRSLLDNQQFSDPEGLAQQIGISSATWPLFGLLWPSGHRLAAKIATRTPIANERMLEIGCGLALASIVAHRQGHDVTASDRHPLTESFLNCNLDLNGLGPMKYRHGAWGEEHLMLTSTELATPHLLTERYDFIMASDVLYERDQQAYLPAFIERHASPQAKVWIVDPDRGNRSAFNQQMSALGFVGREERLDTAATARSLAYRGRLLIYHRGMSAARRALSHR